MYTTGKGLGWELKKSFFITILMCCPIINSFAYFLMNKRVKQKQWKIMGWVFLLLQLLVILGGILASSLIGNDSGSYPKLEDYLGANYYAEYGSDYKTRPEYEQYLKDVEEWENTPTTDEQEPGAGEASLSKEDITMYTVLCFLLLYAVIFMITCFQRVKYLKLLSDKEDEENKASEGLPSEEGAVENEVENVTENETEGRVEPEKPELPMNWFEFVVYIFLFLNAVGSLVNAVNFISGNIYEKQGIEASTIYSMYPQLSMIDKLFGVMWIAIAVLAIFVRQRLAKYKKDGPKLYLLYIVVQISVLVIYYLIVYLIVQATIPRIFIGQILMAGILFAANKKYFEKRKSLFIN